MKAPSARLSPTLTTTEKQAGFRTTGYADPGAARFLHRQPAIYSGLAPPNNSARNTILSVKSAKSPFSKSAKCARAQYNDRQRESRIATE
jgi:hypothetical protein